MFQFFFPKKKPSYLSIHYDNSVDYEEDELQSFGSGHTLHHKYSRTSLLILDYKQFIAARKIQTMWRGFRTRKLFNIRWKAAITMQRWWRGFWVRRNFMDRIEKQLQKALMDHYDQAAIKIQSLFRGWFIRQTVHDMYSLRRMQLCAAEELLSCVAHKLHHLLRTYSIPGVYSLRNSHCLSRVETLLNSMTYRFHNHRVQYRHARQASDIKTRREHFENNKYKTEVPYSGPNFNTLCKPVCEDILFATKDMDKRMYKIIVEYENSQVDPKLQKVHRTLAERKYRKHVLNALARKGKSQRDFCGDVIESMRKWKIWDTSKLTISNDVFRTPENLNHFLEEASKLLREIDARTCHCKIMVQDTIVCQ